MSKLIKKYLNGAKDKKIGVTVKGCDANGMPLDPHHPWNVEKSPATEADEPTAPLHARSRERIEP